MRVTSRQKSCRGRDSVYLIYSLLPVITNGSTPKYEYMTQRGEIGLVVGQCSSLSYRMEHHLWLFVHGVLAPSASVRPISHLPSESELVADLGISSKDRGDMLLAHRRPYGYGLQKGCCAEPLRDHD